MGVVVGVGFGFVIIFGVGLGLGYRVNNVNKVRIIIFKLVVINFSGMGDKGWDWGDFVGLFWIIFGMLFWLMLKEDFGFLFM